MNLIDKFNELHIEDIKECIKIQKWWRRYTNIKLLKRIKNYIQNNLSSDDFKELSEKCFAITKKCKGDGAGLSGGILIDMLLVEFLQTKLTQFKEFHNGESDIIIDNIPLSQKKINGRSTIALDWSKNKDIIHKNNFNYHILIINLKTEQWWKRDKNYNDIIYAGIYIIDKQYCKRFIILSNNNKTDRLIDQKQLYKMLKRSYRCNLFIPLPEPEQNLKFNILNAF